MIEVQTAVIFRCDQCDHYEASRLGNSADHEEYFIKRGWAIVERGSHATLTFCPDCWHVYAKMSKALELMTRITYNPAPKPPDEYFKSEVIP